MKYFFYYLVFINLITIIIYGLDKRFAKKNKARISEQFLFLLALLGGSLGALIGMQLFRHKTKKFKFYLVNFVFSVIWVYVIYKFIYI